MAKVIASLTDGRVVPWFSDENPVPSGFVVVPDELHAKFAAGKIADGVTLAKLAIAAGTAAAPEKPAKAPAEPGFKSVSHLPTEGTMKA